MELVRLEKFLKISKSPKAHSQVPHPQGLEPSRDGDSTASLGSPFQEEYSK